eukprot:3931714-Rhodomonas_salina.1
MNTCSLDTTHKTNPLLRPSKCPPRTSCTDPIRWQACTIPPCTPSTPPRCSPRTQQRKCNARSQHFQTEKSCSEGRPSIANPPSCSAMCQPRIRHTRASHLQPCKGQPSMLCKHRRQTL